MKVEVEEVEEEEEEEYNFFVIWISCCVSVEWTKSGSVGRKRGRRRRKDEREFGSASLPVSVNSVFLCSLWRQYREFLWAQILYSCQDIV